MDESSRPTGRKKRVGSGGGEVYKRGDGLGGQTGGPVGDAGGYSDRTESPPTGQVDDSERGVVDSLLGGGGAASGGGMSPGGSAASGGGRPRSLGCSPKLLPIGVVIIAIIAVVVYVMAGSSGDQTGDQLGSGATATSGLVSGTSLGVNTTLDAGVSPVVTAVSQAARPKRTVLKGNGADTVTVMMYICGTDLESQGGMATADLNEMLYAEDSEKVNVIVETGGTSRWRNSVISSTTNQRYRVTSDGLELLEQNLGKRSMVDPATLSDFIQYSKMKYPADRYILVLWDHGGGSLTGYGYDQNFAKDSMTLDEIGTALKNGGCTFDTIGFDACLMATLETAIVLEPYADYMIASEETEPGIGWYYTGWLSALSANTSIPTTLLGKKVIDDYLAQVKAQVPQSQATLSLIDLAELKGTVPSTFASFAKSTSGLIDADQYQTVSDARADAKEFATSSQINQIDLIDFATRLGTAEATKFAEVLRGCIKYNRTTANIANANGVSIFFPYDRLSQLNPMLETYDEIGIASEYSECIRSYASVAAGGQITSSGSGNFLDVLLGGLSGGTQTTAPSGSSGAGGLGAGALGALLGQFLSSGDLGSITGLTGRETGWLDVGRMQSSLDYYAANRFDASALVITEKDGQRVIALPDEQWDLVQQMELNVFLDDGEGFIDLGLDNVYEYNDDGDLVMEYDGTWLALNGQIVSYYMVTDDRSGDTYCTTGRVPALLNDQLVDIIIVFDNENPYGVVLGARPRYDAATQTETVARGLIDIVPGDKIDYLCDYYTYAGEYNDTYFLGDQYTATGEWQIENLSVGGNPYQMTYRFTDIYNNKYWTPSISD
jgi:Clostripain family